MSARVYACPACGAHVDEQARRCRFCAAPVATVRCATCFHMNVPEAGFCSGCGRELGLEPIGEAAALACPVCKQPLTAFRGAGLDPKSGTLFDCALCGGQFVEHTLLRDLLDHHERASLLPGKSTLAPRPEPRSTYIRCPACTSLMNRKNFGTLSGVIVDVCKQHGTWFDLGELPRVLAFVAKGGLDRARARAAAETADAHRAAVSAAAAVPMPASSSSHDHLALRAGVSLAEFLVDLLLR